jgi:hypothetical protein
LFIDPWIAALFIEPPVQEATKQQGFGQTAGRTNTTCESRKNIGIAVRSLVSLEAARPRIYHADGAHVQCGMANADNLDGTGHVLI